MNGTAAPPVDAASWRGGGGVRRRSAALWRGVEAQHVVATMKLVDSVDEQQLLEELLETSKPDLPAKARGAHYLIATPFRYRPSHASRFRPAGTPGLWYGAEELETACAEVAYWRWRFLTDSAGLADQALHTQHTFFRAEVAGRCVNLLAPPWIENAEAWQQPRDYRACHALAAAAREHGVEWIRYASVRRPGGTCGAVLVPTALQLAPGFAQQLWACKATRTHVFLQHDATTIGFDPAAWTA